jgi:hypothetical protein
MLRRYGMVFVKPKIKDLHPLPATFGFLPELVPISRFGFLPPGDVVGADESEHGIPDRTSLMEDCNAEEYLSG